MPFKPFNVEHLERSEAIKRSKVRFKGLKMDFNLPEGLKMLERTVRRRYEV